MTEEQIIAYLLEELPEEESEQFEDDCLAGEDWPPEVNLAEEDLIDAYLRNELTQERRQRFEQNYLTTEARQERVRMAAALLHHIDECHARSTATDTVSPALPRQRQRFPAFWNNQSWALRAAAMIAAVAVIAGAFWFYLSRSQTPRSFTALNLSITVNNSRGESPQVAKVKLPPKGGALKINLKLPEGVETAQISRVVLEKDSGETKTLEIVEHNAQSVTVVIPAEQLERARYLLKLFERRDDGTEQRINGNYFFTVE
jgi:hypothetical protein